MHIFWHVVHIQPIFYFLFVRQNLPNMNIMHELVQCCILCINWYSIAYCPYCPYYTYYTCCAYYAYRVLLFVFNILCIFKMYKQSFPQFFHRSLSLLLGSPSQGPAVDVPPPKTSTTALGFITDSSWKVRCLSSHVEWYRPCRAHWNQRKASQYAGHWNLVQFHGARTGWCIVIYHPFCV